MTIKSIFKIHDIFEKNFGYEKANEIVITIESIINSNKEKRVQFQMNKSDLTYTMN
jgi:hypothetical protein